MKNRGIAIVGKAEQGSDVITTCCHHGKLKSGHAKLLGGQALRYELTGFSAAECGADGDLVRMLNTGYMPRHYLNPDRNEADLRSYVCDSLKEEIAAEGIVRNLPVFSEFHQHRLQTLPDST